MLKNTMSRSTLIIFNKEGLRNVLAENPVPSLLRGDEASGLIRCWISEGIGCASQVNGKTGLVIRPEAALMSVLFNQL